VREGYTVSLQSGNYENDLHAAHDEAFHADEHDPLVTGSLYIDVNGERTNPDIPKIDALLRVVTGNPSQADTTTAAAEDNPDDLGHRQREVPVISYSIRGQAGTVM